VKSFAATRRRKQTPEATDERPAAHPEALAHLQRSVGNQALAKMLSAPNGARVLQRWGWFGPFRPTAAPPESETTFTCTVEGGTKFRTKKTFPIESFHWSVGQTGTGTGTAKARDPTEEERREFHISRRVDDLSATLMQLTATGEPIAKVEVAMTRSSARVVLRFSDVQLSSYRQGGSPTGDVPVEMVGMEGILDGSSHN
jgi:type VI protein secretion system component Hcp